jgi:imidazolonepropionase-like amidohydrolase
MIRSLLLGIILISTVSGWSSAAPPAPEPAKADVDLRPKPVPPVPAGDIDEAVARGVAFLLKDQNKDGSWGSPHRTKGLNIYAPVPDAHHAFRNAVTALCLMALIEAGGDSKEVIQAIERGETWLMENLPELRRATADALYNIWGHAYGIQALVRMYHRLPMDEARRRKIDELIRGQLGFLARYESVDGGWGYYDFRVGSQRPATDATSFITATGLIAMHEAKDIGIVPSQRLIQKPIASLERQRKPDFSYLYGEYMKWSPMNPINRPGGSLGRSQACNLALRLWGDKRITDTVLKTWLDRLFARNLWLDMGRKRPIPHESHFYVAGYFFYYGHYYASLCIEQLPAEDRPFYQDHLARVMLPLQEKDGSWWDYPLYNYHQQYGTAFALMTLKRCYKAPADKPKAQQGSLVITPVTIVDCTGAAPQADMTVVVTGNRITALGKAGSMPVPDGARVVNGTGKFLIPGLWDMHMHVIGKETFALCLANGVTGIREMANFPQQAFTFRDEIARGTLQGPRMVAAGLIVDGPKPIWPFSIAVANADEGRKAVDSQKKRGSDFIKVYSLLPREAFFAIAEEAKNQGLPFAGHVPVVVTAGEASDAGQKSIEHLTGVVLACSSKQHELHKEAIEALGKPGDPVNRLLSLRAQVKALDSYDNRKAAELFARFARNGTSQCPTLTVLRAFAHLDDKEFTNDPRLKYLSPLTKGFLYPKKPMGNAEYYADRRRLYKKYLELVGAMHRAHVEILAGTDTPNPYCFPGFSLHDELELLVTSGLTPLEALQCATRNPARYLDKSRDLGTVEQGKIADLVLLDADPLADIKNIRKIAAVVTNGKLLPKETIQTMLADVEGMFRK